MASCCRNTWAAATAGAWGGANASDGSNSGGFAAVNPAPRWRKRIRSRCRLLKKLGVLAAREDVEVWSLDECHFQQHGTRCRRWVPPEETDPIVLHAPTRKSIACFGAVSLCRGTFVWRFSTPFNAAPFQVSLSQLLRHRPRHKQMIVLLDNALPPRPAPAPLAPPISRPLRPLVPPSLQSATRPDRTCLETGPPFGYPQPVLPRPRRAEGGPRTLLRPLAQAQRRPHTIMRHHLRRCV